MRLEGTPEVREPELEPVPVPRIVAFDELCRMAGDE